MFEKFVSAIIKMSLSKKLNLETHSKNKEFKACDDVNDRLLKEQANSENIQKELNSIKKIHEDLLVKYQKVKNEFIDLNENLNECLKNKKKYQNQVNEKEIVIESLKSELELTKSDAQNKSLYLQDQINIKDLEIGKRFLEVNEKLLESNYLRGQLKALKNEFEISCQELQNFIEEDLISEKNKIDNSSALIKRIKNIYLNNAQLIEFESIHVGQEDDGLKTILKIDIKGFIDSRSDQNTSFDIRIVLIENKLKLEVDGVDLNLILSETKFQYFFKFKISLSILNYIFSQNKNRVSISPQVDMNFWKPYQKIICDALESLNNKIYYDEVILKRELINADYEHLWLEIKNLCYQNYFFPKYEIRLSASEVSKNEFSIKPKIEFPLIGGKFRPFDSWYSESVDEFGPKFELRFSVQKRVMDLNALEKLDIGDRIFVLKISTMAPSLISSLENNGNVLYRDIGAWKDLFSKAVEIIKEKSDLSIFKVANKKTLLPQDVAVKEFVVAKKKSFK